MLKANRSPLPLGLAAFALLVLLWFKVPDNGTVWAVLLTGTSVVIALHVAMTVLNKRNPPPVPDYAISNLLDLSGHSVEEWLLVEFEPALDLRGARERVGSDSYSQEDRRKAFLRKTRLYAPFAPSVAFFHSKNKGYLLANRTAVLQLLEKHGRWTIDNWYAMAGAARRLGLKDESMDEPKMVPV